MPQLRNNKLFLLLVATIVLAGMIYLLYLSGLLDLFTNKARMLDLIQRHRTYSALIFIGLQAAQVVAAPIPGELTGFVGGMVFGPVAGIAYSMIGLSIGSWLAFMVARLLGRPLVERIVSVETLQRYDYVMRHKGLFLAFLLFLIPGFPKDYLCYVLGLGHMRQRDFLLVAIAGRLVGTVLLTIAGSYFRAEHYGAFFVVLGVSVVLVLLAMVYRNRLERWFHFIGKHGQEPPADRKS